MRELEKSFEGKGQVKGYTFNQITASLYGFIYEKSNNQGGKTFEVFKRRENSLYNIVSYPGSKSFGIWAWEVGTLERANQILEEIDYKEALKLTVQ